MHYADQVAHPLALKSKPHLQVSNQLFRLHRLENVALIVRDLESV